MIGGSGFYSFFTDAERHRRATPFGEPSDDIVIGSVGDRRVAFVARHGQGHRFAPHLSRSGLRGPSSTLPVNLVDAAGLEPM